MGRYILVHKRIEEEFVEALNSRREEGYRVVKFTYNRTLAGREPLLPDYLAIMERVKDANSEDVRDMD